MTLFHRIIDRLLVFILRDVASYRFSVISRNLKASFKYSSDTMLKRDIEGNYRFLAKIIRQTCIQPTPKMMSKRMTINHLEDIDQWISEGKSIVVTMGHVGNWEWAGVYLGLRYPGRVCALYKRIKSPIVHNWMMRRRKFMPGYLVEAGKMNELLRLMKQQPVMVLLIADQNPGNDQGMIWTDFLGQKTAFASGPETLAMKYNLPVLYLHNSPRVDGGYELHLEILTSAPALLQTGEITSLYARALEKNIIQHRHAWLWSHKRWKRNPVNSPAANGN